MGMDVIRVFPRIKIRPVWVDDSGASGVAEPAAAGQLSLALSMSEKSADGGRRLKALDEHGRLRLAILASTPDIDEQNDIVEPSAFASSIDGYNENPKLLAHHDTKQPVGLAPASVTKQGLELDAFVSSGRPDIQQLVLDGVLSHASIGFIPKLVEWDESLEVLRIKDLELIENSLVSFPANRATSVTVLDALKEWRAGEIVRRKSLSEGPTEEPEPEVLPEPEGDDGQLPDDVLESIELVTARIADSFARAIGCE